MVFMRLIITQRLKINDNMSDRKGELCLARQLKNKIFYNN